MFFILIYELLLLLLMHKIKQFINSLGNQFLEFQQ
jgi:hypothetical protein